MGRRLLPRNLPELYSYSIAIERDAARRFAELERFMRDTGIEHVADELEKAQEWIMLLGRMTAEQKMAVFLLSVMKTAADDKPGSAPAREMVIELPLSRTEIADYLGLTIETVSRQIARLRERNVISAGNTRSVVVHRPDVLAAIVDRTRPAGYPVLAANQVDA